LSVEKEKLQVRYLSMRYYGFFSSFADFGKGGFQALSRACAELCHGREKMQILAITSMGSFAPFFLFPSPHNDFANKSSGWRRCYRVFTNAAAGNCTGRQNWGTLCGKVFVVAEVQTCFGRVMLMSYVEGLHARVPAGSIDFEIRLNRSKILGTGKCQCSWIL
jgi:hypothetical protein